MKKILSFFLAMLSLTFAAAGQEVSEWCGCARYDYQVNGRDATVVVPQNPAPGKPWIWRPAFFGAFPSVDEALLKDGWHIAYYDVTHCYGCPESVEWAYDFYDDAQARFGLNEKVTIEGFSRGGIFCVAGPDAAVISYRIDRGEWKELDTFTHWSDGLYIPWVHMLGEDLPDGLHSLEIKVPTDGNRRGCVIKNFVVN